MAEFVRAQIFGTTFEITSRYLQLLRAAILARIFKLTLIQVHRSSARRHGSLRVGLVRTLMLSKFPYLPA